MFNFPMLGKGSWHSEMLIFPYRKKTILRRKRSRKKKCVCIYNLVSGKEGRRYRDTVKMGKEDGSIWKYSRQKYYHQSVKWHSHKNKYSNLFYRHLALLRQLSKKLSLFSNNFTRNWGHSAPLSTCSLLISDQNSVCFMKNKTVVLKLKQLL